MWRRLRTAIQRHRLLAGAVAVAACLVLLNALCPPDMHRARDLSRQVAAADGEPLRQYLTADGMMRRAVPLADVNPRYVALLVAYEDQRFYRHAGVDGLALGRALVQALRAGHVVSGGSTLTMQVARLLEPRPRTLGAKFIEILRAWQLEARYSKREILELYCLLAPMGGNLEGISAAAGQYFNKPAAHVSLADAAALIALPQSPTRLRRDPAALRAARNKILLVAGRRTGLADTDIRAAITSPVQLQARGPAFSAPHLSDRMLARITILAPPGASLVRTSLSSRWQHGLERNAQRWRRALDPRASLAVLVIDIRSRAVRSYLGTADFTAPDRAGQVDMVTAIRSPGSTLKPFIYARAFDAGLAHPLTLVDDVETRFGSYTPTNFQDQYHGRVTLADALRLSLNVPAVLLLDRMGPVAFTQGMRRAGLPLALPDSVAPGLPVALGGVGVTLEHLGAAYAALADDGIIRPLVYGPADRAAPVLPDAFAGEQARAAVAQILRTTVPPDGVAARSAATRAIALKTGTSYGYRDAWALGFDGSHVVAVWTGRPDGTPSPGHYGVNTAAPILYDVFDLIGVQAPRRAANQSVDRQAPAALAALAPGAAGAAQRSLKIAFPVNGIVLPFIAGKPVPLEARGGRAPFLWTANGMLVGTAGPGQSLMWLPDGPGFHALSVVDASGRAVNARVRISETAAFEP